MRRQTRLILGIVVVSLGGRAALAQNAASVVAAAGREGKYAFVLFHKQDDEATRAVRQALDAALVKRPGQATSALVRLSDPAEKALVDRYGVSRSPMPLVLAIAPNGAVTGAFAIKLTEKDVAGAFVSHGQAACMKAVQSRKLVLVCVRPASDPNDVPVGVREFKADARYGPATEVVSLRGDDGSEAGFLKTLQINPTTTTPITALLAPPGRVLGIFAGAVTKQQLIERVTSPQGCCPGGKCCPGGCCGKP